MNTPSPSTTLPKERALKDVWLFVPNQIGYLRVLMGFSPVLLDMVDGKIARYLNQASDFGMAFDYTIDIVTGACFLLKLCSLATVPTLLAPWLLPAICSAAIAVETTGLVLAVHGALLFLAARSP
jgi:phosphatidylglycerophosphate synthase